MPSGRCHGQQVVVGRAPCLKVAGGHPRSARLVCPGWPEPPPASPPHPQPAGELEGTRWLVCLDPTLLVSLETVCLVSFCLERFSRKLGQEGSCVPPPPHTQFSCINIWLASGLPWRPDSKESAYGAGHLASVPGSGRSPGEGNGYPLQYSCMENPMDGEPGGLQSMGVAKSRID